MIQVVLWDIDGTLLDFGGAERHAIRKCFSLFGLGECSDEMLRRYSEINKKYWRLLEDGKVTRPEVFSGRFRDFFAGEGIDFPDIDALNQEYQLRLGDCVLFNDSALETVTGLKNRVKQYAVTNGSRIAQERKLEKSGLSRIFDGVFISEAVGAEKPDAAFFDRIWAEIGPVAREEAMIVGDSLNSDIRGGNNAGIRCCWYNPGGEKLPEGLRVDYEISSLRQMEAIVGGENAAFGSPCC